MLPAPISLDGVHTPGSSKHRCATNEEKHQEQSEVANAQYAEFLNAVADYGSALDNTAAVNGTVGIGVLENGLDLRNVVTSRLRGGVTAAGGSVVLDNSILESVEIGSDGFGASLVGFRGNVMTENSGGNGFPQVTCMTSIGINVCALGTSY